MSSQWVHKETLGEVRLGAALRLQSQKEKEVGGDGRGVDWESQRSGQWNGAALSMKAGCRMKN